MFTKSILSNLEIINSMFKREVRSRYEGSLLGKAWLIFQPLCMLLIYTIIFSQVFKTRWPGSGETGNTLGFACNLFAGLITFNFFAEIFGRSPRLIAGNPNYVKKIIFPLEILSCVNIMSAVFSAVVSFSILFIATLIAFGKFNLSFTVLPAIWASYIFLCLGTSWIVAALGVYVRDLEQLTGLIMTILMFMSPIFFPIEALPQGLRWLTNINPLAWYIESTRQLTIASVLPNPSECILRLIVSLIYTQIAFSWFRMMRKGFSDVL